MNDRLAAVIQATNRNREQFERFCRSLSDDELQRAIPDSHWRVADYIAHLGTIDIWIAQWFEAMTTGQHFVPRAKDGGAFDIDEWNDARINERKDATIEAILAEAAQTRVPLLATFDRFSEETLDSRFNFRGKDISFIEYLEAWTLHDPAHSMDMLKALPERKDDPEIRTWIDAFKAEAIREVADVKANEG